MADVSFNGNFMKRIAFLDGQVLHDFHLNIMQKNVAEAIKLQTTYTKYDFYLLVSPYNQYFVEPFINENYKSPSSTADLNSLAFSISSGSWVGKLLELPAVTEEICLVSNFEDYINQGAYVKFYYRTSESNEWIPMNVDVPTYLSEPKKYIQIKVECSYQGIIRPAVYDYALLWK